MIGSWESGSLLSFATIAGDVEDAGDESPTTDVSVEKTGGGVGGTGGGIRETCGGLAGRSLVISPTVTGVSDVMSRVSVADAAASSTITVVSDVMFRISVADATACAGLLEDGLAVGLEIIHSSVMTDVSRVAERGCELGETVRSSLLISARRSIKMMPSLFVPGWNSGFVVRVWL